MNDNNDKNNNPPVLPLNKILESQGYIVEDVADDDDTITLRSVTDNTTEKRSIKEILTKDLGANINNGLNLEVNNPDNPAKGRLDVLDRAALSFGNKAGSIEYLKKIKEDAGFNQSGDLVFKDKGIWRTIEHDGTDMLDSVHEVVGDIADVVGHGVAMLPAFAATPTVVGATAGAVTGAMVRMAAGKLLGSYKEEEAGDFEKDLAFEGIAATLGFGLINKALPAAYKAAMGRKIAETGLEPVQEVKTVLNKLGSLADDATTVPAGVREGIIDTFAEATQASPALLDGLKNNLKAVTSKTSEIIKLAENVGEEKAKTAFQQRAKSSIQEVYTNISKHITNTYGTRLNEVLDGVNNSVDLKTATINSVNNLSQHSVFGSFFEKTATGIKLIDKSKLKNIPQQSLVVDGELVNVNSVYNTLKNVVALTDNISNQTNMIAAKNGLKGLSKVIDGIDSPVLSKDLFNSVSVNIKNSIMKALPEHKKVAFSELQNFWKTNGDLYHQTSKLKNFSESKISTIYNKLASGSDDLISVVSAAVSYGKNNMGQAGREAVENMQATVLAPQLMNKVPNWGVARRLGATAGAVGGLTGGIPGAALGTVGGFAAGASANKQNLLKIVNRLDKNTKRRLSDIGDTIVAKFAPQIEAAQKVTMHSSRYLINQKYKERLKARLNKKE